MSSGHWPRLIAALTRPWRAAGAKVVANFRPHVTAQLGRILPNNRFPLFIFVLFFNFFLPFHFPLACGPRARAPSLCGLPTLFLSFSLAATGPHGDGRSAARRVARRGAAAAARCCNSGGRRGTAAAPGAPRAPGGGGGRVAAGARRPGVPADAAERPAADLCGAGKLVVHDAGRNALLLAAWWRPGRMAAGLGAAARRRAGHGSHACVKRPWARAMRHCSPPGGAAACVRSTGRVVRAHAATDSFRACRRRPRACTAGWGRGRVLWGYMAAPCARPRAPWAVAALFGVA